MPEVTSTSFGLIISVLLPGFVALLSLGFWVSTMSRAFGTFLTARANIGLFLLLLLGALVLGLVVSVVRWMLYEVLFQRMKLTDPPLTQEQLARLAQSGRLAAFRATVDETYRYHQFFGGLTVAAPALFVGWLGSFTEGWFERILLITAFAAIEVLLACGAVNSRNRYLRFTKAILAGDRGLTS